MDKSEVRFIITMAVVVALIGIAMGYLAYGEVHASHIAEDSLDDMDDLGQVVVVMQYEVEYDAFDSVCVSGQVYVDGIVYEFKLVYDWQGNLQHRYIAYYATVADQDVFV